MFNYAKVSQVDRWHGVGRDMLSEYLQPRTYDFEHRCFQTMDQCLGLMFELQPFAFAGEKTVKTIELILTMDMPDMTSIQFILLADPRVGPLIDKWKSALSCDAPVIPSDAKPVLKEWVKNFGHHLNTHSKEGFDVTIPVPVRNFRLFLCIKTPYKIKQYEKACQELKHRKNTIFGSLQTAGFGPVEADPAILLDAMRYFYNPSYYYGQQNGNPYNRMMFLNRQVIENATDIAYMPGRGGGLQINEKHVGVYTVKTFPENINYFELLYLVGDIFTKNLEQIRVPFALHLTCLRTDTNSEIKNKAKVMLAQKAPESMAPVLKLKQDDFSHALTLMQGGTKFLSFMFSAVTFCDNEEEKAEVGGTLEGMFRNRNFHIQEERHIALASFMSSTPFGVVNNKRTIDNMARFEQAPSRTIAEMVPIQADWKGVPSPVFNLVTRRGQLMGLDLFLSDGNYNAAIAAESGKGKSFFAQYLLMCYLCTGAKAMVIDNGKSFSRFVEVMQGQYIEFSEESEICINPFSLVDDIRGDMPMVLPMLVKMAKPKEGCDDYEATEMKEAIIRTYEKHGKKTTVSKVSELLMEDQRNNRRYQLGLALQDYGTHGTYGKWFEGDCTLSKEQGQLEVLELGELNRDPHLKFIVLLFILYRASQMMLKNPQQRKIALIDEASKLFSEGTGDSSISVIGEFVEDFYRRARKTGGSVITIVQRISDYFATKSTEAMIANAAFWLFLSQKDEEVDNAVNKGWLNLNPFMIEYFKSVHTIKGKYSEIFIKTDGGVGIGRLFVDPFSYGIFTTEPSEVAYLQSLAQRGMSVHDAISHAIKTDYGKKRMMIQHG